MYQNKVHCKLDFMPSLSTLIVWHFDLATFVPLWEPEWQHSVTLKMTHRCISRDTAHSWDFCLTSFCSCKSCVCKVLRQLLCLYIFPKQPVVLVDFFKWSSVIVLTSSYSPRDSVVNSKKQSLFPHKECRLRAKNLRALLNVVQILWQL